MDYSYIAYTKERKLVRGKVSAADERAALGLLDYGGFNVVNIKALTKIFDFGKLAEGFAKVDPRELVMFSRQLALLVESGVGVIRGLELLQLQVRNPLFGRALGAVISDIQEGKSLSTALGGHPKIFPAMYSRAISAGEQAGNLDEILRQMADFTERSIEAQKKIKGALTYPAVIVVVAVIVVGVLVTFVLPAYTKLFAEFGATLPLTTRILMGFTGWAAKFGLYVMGFFLALVIGGFLYTKTAKGAYLWDKITLQLPVMGRINLLNHLSYSCRIMALLFRVGLRPPDVVAMAVDGSLNKVLKKSLQEVQEEMIRGEGLSRPMSRRSVFLPLMVQMVAVGEETGNLAKAFTTVAQSYEVDADDRTRAAIGMIQPTVTLVMGGVVVFIATALVSAMYGIFGQLNL